MKMRRLLLSMLSILLLLGSMSSTLAKESTGLEAGIPLSQSLENDLDSTQVGVQEKLFQGNIELSGEQLEEQTVTESVYQIGLFAEKTQLVIYPGESVQFTNDTNTLLSVSTDAKSTNDIRYDYVSYNSEGKVSSDDLEHTGSVSVYSKGGRTVITVDYGYPLTVSFNSEITYSYTSNPALLKKKLYRGESYLFSNQAYAARNIMSDATTSNGKRYDFAVYKSNGALERSSFESSAKPSFSVGDEIILTGASDTPVTVAVPYEGFFGYETEEPAYDSVLLYPGESYQFTNVGTKSNRVEHAGTTKDKFDYVVYNSDGTETSRGTNTSTLPLVAVGRYVVLTLVTENPVRVGAPYRSFMGGQRKDDAISRVTVYPGESYLFTNNGTLLNPVNNNARAVDGFYDYTVYKADGGYASQGFNAISTPQLPAGGIAVITVQGTHAVTFDYTDDFSAEPSDEPSHFRVTLTEGKSYEFKNITSSTRILRSNATSSNRFDWVEYYPDGTQQAKRANTYTDPQVSGGNSIVVTAVSAPVTFGANYRLFSWKDKPGEAISKKAVHLGETYTFNNTGSRLIMLTSDANQAGGKYDVAVYNNDGRVHSAKFDETGNVAIPAGGYAIITGQSASPITISYTDAIFVSSAEYPAMLRATVSLGDSYTYKNVSGDTEYVYSNASPKTNEFAYVIRRPDGTISNEGSSRYTSVQVSAGYSVTVMPLTATVTFGGVYTSFIGTPGENPEVKQVTLSKNESYSFTNISTTQQKLTSNAAKNLLSMFDFAMYGFDGKPEKADFDQEGNLSVPEGSQVVVTVVTDHPVTFTYGQVFQATPSVDPALLKKTLESNQSIGFKNKSFFEAKLTTNASTANKRYFDYTIYDSNGTVIRQGEHSTTSYGIPPGGKIQVKTTSENPVILVAPYRVFEFVEIEEYKFEELLHRQRLYVNKMAGENGYYRFVAPETGHYRFVTMEMNSFIQQPILTLYDRPDLLEPIGSSKQNNQEFGLDYTVLETDLVVGQIVYLKLSEEDGLPLMLQLTVSIMSFAPETKYQYTKDGKLLQMAFPSGDALIYEYDPNGNLKRRVKKVFPF